MVSVEIKYHTFQTFSHQKQLETASNADQVIYKADESVPDSTIPRTIRMLLYKSPDLHCSPSQAVSDGKTSETCGI